MKRNIFFVAFTGFVCMSATRCSTQGEGTSDGGGKIKLQATWAKSMRVSVSYGGGMVDESRHIEISSDSAIYETREHGMTGRYRLDFSKEDLDAMAKVFYENDFVNIKSTEREGTIYDAPSSSVMVCVGYECVTKGDDAYSVYAGSNAERIEKVSGYVWQAGNKKLEAHKIPLTVEVAEELLKGKDDIHYQISPGNISWSAAYNGRTDKEEYKILPGNVMIMVNTITKDSLGYTQYPLSTQQTFSTKDANTIFISLKKGALNIELKKR